MEKLIVAVVIVAVILVYVVPLVITGLKGKQGMAAAGVLFHVVWWVGAIRLARPDSYWARRFYDEDKLDRAGIRFPTVPMTQHRSDRLAALSGTTEDD